jgi:hypothetical protein
VDADGARAGAGQERTIADLVRLLAGDLGELARREAGAAREEVGATGRAAATAAALIGAAAIVAFLCAGLAVALLVLLLSEIMDAWLAALIVLIALAALGAGLFLAGRAALRRVPPPLRRTTESIREDVEWIREHRRRGTSRSSSPGS